MANNQPRASRTIAKAAIFVLALLSLPARAATDAERAEGLIRDGVRLRGQDQTSKALPLFEQAYQLSRTPRTAGQLGLCELELGHYVEAERHLTEALASPEHPWIAHNKAVLKRELQAAAANIGELALTLSPPDAEVSLNGKPIDRTSLNAPIRLGKGPVDVDVRAPGYQPAHETVTVEGGKREQRAFALMREPPPPVVASAAPPPAGAGAPPANAVTAPVLDDVAPPLTSTRSQPARTAAWITGGAALGGLALGVVEAFNAASKRDAFNNHSGMVGGVSYPDCGTANLSPACKPLKDSYDRALTLSIVGFATAGALAAASSILFVYASSGHAGDEEKPAGHALACVPDLSTRGFGCALRF